MDYEGYKLVDKVIIFAKDIEADYLPAFVADPLNKSQVKNAKEWASYKEYGHYNKELNKFERSREIEGLQFNFDNSGFRLSLLDCAGHSSQGGKLSFWNCIIEKESKKFKIGINTNLLLDVLKEGTFEKGVCKENVCFVSKNGQTGVCIEKGEIYKHAIKDMQLKQNVKNQQTTHYKFGDCVRTVTLNEIYLGKMYKYYDVVTDKKTCCGGYHYTLKVIKLRNPKPIHIFSSSANIKHIEDIFNKPYLISTKDKLTKRIIDNTSTITVDITEHEFNDLFYKKLSTFDEYRKFDYFKDYYTEELILYDMLNSTLFGIADEFKEIDEHTKELMDKYNFKYEEE